MLFFLLFSCDDLTDKPSTTLGESGEISETGTAEIYILNEGLFNQNNSTLARYSFGSDKRVGNYFQTINRRGLGDTANDLAIYGNKLYIVVNVSSTVEVIDLRTGNSVKQIPMLTDNGSSRQPRFITFHENKAYVCSYDGSVARIDTTSLEIDALTQAGRNADGICVQSNKLYVSNSGGLDYSGPGVDHTVSVIDIPTFKETKQIEVGPNPGKILPGPDGSVYVVTRGSKIEEGDYHFVKIDSRTDVVSKTYSEKVLNFAIDESIAYLYTYNYTTKASAIKVFDLQTEKIIRENFITDGTVVHTPYSIQVNPFSRNIYITEAYNYTVKGDVLCFDQQGQLVYRLNEIGLNPNAIAFSNRASQSNVDDTPENPNAPNAFANKVWDYVPAPGQFVNTTTSAYKDGFIKEQVLEYATQQVKNKSILTLGGFGGYIVLGFHQPIRNVSGEYDFKVYGNASYNKNTATGALGGAAEPGIVLVSKDTNGNGLPDDEWYELAGSEYGKSTETRGYEITYYRPQPSDGDVAWKDNQGNSGFILRNSYHQQSSYYPNWLGNEQTFKGVRLKDNAFNEGGTWVGYCYGWGYADNHPNNTEYAKFKIDWAVDQNGKSVKLDRIDFVKIYTAVNQNVGWMGEISTEVSTVENLHFEKQLTSY